VSYDIASAEKGDDGYFTVHWSPLYKADKYKIHMCVPSVGGVTELYYKDEMGRLMLFRCARSWFGGLRAVIRESTDFELEKDEKLRSILREHKDRIFYRYSCCDIKDDLDDVLFFLYETYAPGKHALPHSGRYQRIFVNEVDAVDKGDF
jgi:hypothetical protein